MFVSINGDFSKLPEPIREIFKLLHEHVIGLYEGYGVYEHLFMASREKTKTLDTYTGSVLAWFQNFLQDGMCLQIVKLTEQDNRFQENLSLNKLAELGCPLARDPAAFESGVRVALGDINYAVRNIRTHRHKRLGHFDLKVSLIESLVSPPVFQDIHEAIKMLGEFLNGFAAEFGHPTTLYESVRAQDVTDRLEITVRKAIAYDALEAEGRVDRDGWVNVTENFHRS